MLDQKDQDAKKANNSKDAKILETLKQRLETTPDEYNGVISSFHRDVCKDGFGLEGHDVKGISAGK